MIMHSVDPEDTYTIDINRKKNENFSSLDLTKSRITMISTLPAFVTDSIEFIFWICISSCIIIHDLSCNIRL
jgi:hypothetical protein